MNEYQVVRMQKAVAGTPGMELDHDDPSRMRYYVRADSRDAALLQMSTRFPDETHFHIVGVTENVAPLFTDDGDKKQAKADKRRKSATDKELAINKDEIAASLVAEINYAPVDLEAA